MDRALLISNGGPGGAGLPLVLHKKSPVTSRAVAFLHNRKGGLVLARVMASTFFKAWVVRSGRLR